MGEGSQILCATERMYMHVSRMFDSMSNFLNDFHCDVIHCHFNFFVYIKICENVQ